MGGAEKDMNIEEKAHGFGSVDELRKVHRLENLQHN